MTPRRRSSFSLRTLLIVVSIAAGACWLGIQLSWIHSRHARIESLGMLLDDVEYYGEADAPAPLRMFGERGWAKLMLGRRSTSHELRELHALFPEAQIVVCDIRAEPGDPPADPLGELPFVRVCPPSERLKGGAVGLCCGQASRKFPRLLDVLRRA